MVDFFNRINLIYGTICEFCTEQSCPTMSGGSRFEYLWADGKNFKKPTPLPARQYISHLMDWIEGQINNQALFPCTSDMPFPKNFASHCSKILARLHRVFVHVYIHHFQNVVAISAVSNQGKHVEGDFNLHNFRKHMLTPVINTFTTLSLNII